MYRKILFVLVGLFICYYSGCSSVKEEENCKYDTDCPGLKVCRNNKCVNTESDAGLDSGIKVEDAVGIDVVSIDSGGDIYDDGIGEGDVGDIGNISNDVSEKDIEDSETLLDVGEDDGSYDIEEIVDAGEDIVRDALDGEGDVSGDGTDGGVDDGSSSCPDPGWRSNQLWVPPGSTDDRVIADRGGSSTLWVAYIPGCLNGGETNFSYEGCAVQNYYYGKEYCTGKDYYFRFESGRILGLRYKSKPDAGTSMKYFQLKGGSGGNVGSGKQGWLSQDPYSTYESVDPKCRFESTDSSLYWFTGPGYCPIEPNKLYYLFIKEGKYSVTTYQLWENTSDFE